MSQHDKIDEATLSFLSNYDPDVSISLQSISSPELHSGPSFEGQIFRVRQPEIAGFNDSEIESEKSVSPFKEGSGFQLDSAGLTGKTGPQQEVLDDDISLDEGQSPSQQTGWELNKQISELVSARALEPMDEEDSPIGTPSSPIKGSEISNSDEFVLVKLIGQGGQGQVWEARQTSLSREVAVKCHMRGLTDEFLTEAYTSGTLNHPNIIPVYDMGTWTDPSGKQHPILAMKRVKGKSWHQEIKDDRKNPNFTDEEFLTKHLSILIDVAHAVDFAHARGIIHRDLKPDQVMVGGFGEVYLMDWGLAISVTSGEQVPRSLREGIPMFRTMETATNCAGTPSYMAPEQTDIPTSKLGKHTDIYLLGATLYRIVTGFPPHHSQNALNAFKRAEKNDWNPLDASVPQDLRNLIGRCLATSPNDRPTSIRDVIEQLLGYLSGASRRLESMELTVDVQQKLKQANVDYQVLGRCVHQLDRAIGLWNGNENARTLREQALQQYTNLAVQKNDLNLALVQAELVSDSTQQQNLLEQIKSKQKTFRRQKWQRRLASLGVLLLLGVLSIGGVKYSIDQQKAQDEMADRLSRGERLVNFMMDDLYTRLKGVGRLEYLGEAADKVLEFYTELPEDELNDFSRLNQVVAVGNIAQIYNAQGRQDESVATIQRALSMLDDHLVSSQSDLNPQFIIEKANLLNTASRIKESTGQIQEAAQSAETGIAILKDLPSAYENNIRFLEVKADLHDRLATLAMSMGDAKLETEQNELHYEAMNEVLAIRGDARGSDDRFKKAQSFNNAAASSFAVDKFDEGGDFLKLGYQTFQELLRESPDRADYLEASAENLWELTDFHFNDGDLEEALRLVQVQVEQLTHLAQLDPDNLNYQAKLHNGYMQWGMLLTAEGEYDAGLEKIAFAERLLVPLTEKQPDNFEWIELEATLYLQLAEAHYEEGDYRLAIVETEKSLPLWRRLVRRSDRNNRELLNYGHALEILGEARREMGNLPAANDAFQQSLALIDQWLEREPNNPEAHLFLVETVQLAAPVLFHLGEIQKADFLFKRARSSAETVLRSRFDDLEFFMMLARLNYDFGELKLAQRELTQLCISHFQNVITNLNELIEEMGEEEILVYEEPILLKVATLAHLTRLATLNGKSELFEQLTGELEALPDPEDIEEDWPESSFLTYLVTLEQAWCWADLGEGNWDDTQEAWMVADELLGEWSEMELSGRTEQLYYLSALLAQIDLGRRLNQSAEKLSPVTATFLSAMTSLNRQSGDLLMLGYLMAAHHFANEREVAKRYAQELQQKGMTLPQLPDLVEMLAPSAPAPSSE